jgi:2-hydroxy-3-keto-5-methylthiopentenyl-1-phosphate phosphatase
LLPVNLGKLKNKAFEWAEIRPGFKTLLQKARLSNNPVIIASDGLGFYIEPILERYGLLSAVDMIYRNDTFINSKGLLEISNPHAHPTCLVCGNCKARIVVQQKTAGRPVVYIGDGSNDRFGASWADRIFAREELAASCANYNLEYSPWDDFYDIINIEDPVLSDRSKPALCCPLDSGVKL